MRRLTLAAVLVLSGCAASGASGAQSSAGDSTPRNEAAPEAQWWTASDDPTLIAVMDRAGQSAAPQQAQANLAAAIARLDAARASLWPQLTFSLAGMADAAETGGASSISAGFYSEASRNVAGADSLRVRSAAARQALAEADLAQARLDARTLAGQLYVALRIATSQAESVAQSLAAAEESLSIAASRERAGLENGLAVAQAQTARDRVAARIPGAAQAEIEAIIGLRALLGQAAKEIVDAPRSTVHTSALTVRIEGIPAEAVARRPDVARALALRQAVDFDARAAQADRWPTVSLASLLSNTDATARTLPPGGQIGSATLSLLQPMFDAGRRRALARAAGAEAQAAQIAFEQSVLEAVNDIDRALSRQTQTQAALSAQTAAVASARQGAELARDRYTRGLTSFLAVATADAVLAEAQTDLAAAQGARAEAAILLAQALGLGTQQ